VAVPWRGVGRYRIARVEVDIESIESEACDGYNASDLRKITTADLFFLEQSNNMSHIAILLIILSATLHAIWNFLVKRGENILLFFWWSVVFELSVFAPLIIYILPKSTVDAQAWYIILASGTLSLLFWVLLVSSYKYGDLSLVYPITRSTPIFVSILAVIFFKERLSPLGVFGILLVVVSVYIIPMNSLVFRNFIRPFSHLKSKAILFAALAALSASFHHLVDKVGTRFFNPLVYVWLVDFVGFIFLSLSIAFSEKRRFVRKEWSLNKWHAAATGILIICSYSLIVFVMRFENISYIISMRQISIVFGVILGNMILKERYGLIRFIASCLIFIGVFSIGIAE
jgi:drug/metabolite transporter (DMT)-like permease